MNRHNMPRGHGRAMSLGECQAALASAEQEIADLRDKYLRAAAAIENTRKQAERAAAERAVQRLKNFSAHLIEVADNLERALSHASQGDSLAPGVRATLQLLHTILRQEGVEPIAVEVGARFDPQYHEAIAGHIADVPRELIAEVTQTGYTFDGQVLRPARVVVAQPPNQKP